MSIPTECESCGRHYKVRDDLSGRTIKCKECGEPIYVGEAQPTLQRTRSRNSGPTQRNPQRRSMPKWLPWAVGGGVVTVAVLVLIIVQVKQNSFRSVTDVLEQGSALEDEYLLLLESVTDEASARAAVPRFEDIGQRKKDYVRRMESYMAGRATSETLAEFEAFANKRKPHSADYNRRKFGALARIRSNPAIKSIVWESLRKFEEN